MPSVPHEPLLRLFLRFLRFGLLAWGGPVAQIGMIRQELVEEEQWISRDHFNRALAVYQVLPGPEANELCVYFGMLSRGRIGGLLAGLGFFLPGFILMFGLSFLYLRFGLEQPLVLAAFGAVQAAVAALIVRAVFRIGAHALLNRWLWLIGVAAGVAHLSGVHFTLTLGVAGVAYLLAGQSRHALGLTLVGGLVVAAIALLVRDGLPLLEWGGALSAQTTTGGVVAQKPSLLSLSWSGLKTGLLTFGGAYTAIPFLREDAVEAGRWMTNAQFLDGLAIGGVLPAPLIIFSTFVGFVGGGPMGALVVTLGVFVPAFSFTLLGHGLIERVIAAPRFRHFLEGVTAGVVGLIAATALDIIRVTVVSVPALLAFAAALAVLFRWNGRWVIPTVVFGAAAFGLALHALG